MFSKFTQPVESARIGKGSKIIPPAVGFMAGSGPGGEDKQQFSCSGAEGDSSEGLEEEL